jgi:enterochelin esterase family protein
MVRSASFRALLLGTLVAGACSSSASEPGVTGTGGGVSTGSGGAAPTGSGGNAVGTGGSTPARPIGPTGSTRGVQATGGRAGGTGGVDAAGGRGVASGGAGPVAGATGSTDPGTVGDGEIDVGPTYTSSPDLTPRAGAPAGTSNTFTMTSAMSNIFKGDDFTPPLTFSRTITYFVPKQYVDGTESPFMVSSDGFYAGLRTVVQNLADDPSPDHRVPPLAIIGIQNGPDVRPSSERSLEYDSVSDRYWQFVTKEVIPAVLADASVKLRTTYPNFKLTSDPNGRGGYGCSSGGPAVMGLAWFGDFNRVFSFSGSYTALHPTPDHPNGAWEYPAMVMAAPFRADLRVFLEVGENDNGSTTPDSGHRNWVTSNRSLAAALMAKGNHTRFIFARGAGHCDNAARNQVMPAGLIWLWRDYQAR